MVTLDSLFEQFVRERTYLHNVTLKTRDWYQSAWKAFTRFQADAPPRPTNAPLISRLDLQQFVVNLRERGIKPVSCNCWLGALNAFCGWLHEQGAIPDAPRLRPQKLRRSKKSWDTWAGPLPRTRGRVDWGKTTAASLGLTERPAMIRCRPPTGRAGRVA